MPSAVREVDPTSLGSGARLREFVKLPKNLVISILVLRWMIKHWLFMLNVVVMFILWYAYGLDGWWKAILLVVGAWVAGICALWCYLGAGLNTTFWYCRLHNRWRHTVVNVGLQSRDKLHVPKLYRVRPVKNGLKFNVNMSIAGRTVNDLQAESDDMCEILGFTRVQVFPLKPGKARVVMHWNREPIQNISEIDAGMSARELQALEGDHTHIKFGETGSGGAFLSLLVSLLIVGLSRSGKSNILRVIFHALVKRNIPFELYVIDPSDGVELGELEHHPNTLGYAESPEEINSLVSRAYKDLRDRFKEMKRLGRNKITPSEEFPLRIIIIDEFLALDKQAKEVPDSELGQILFKGAKAATVVIALAQLSQIDVIGRVRGLFPQRICLATENDEMTDACLGKGASAAGAKCAEISLSTPGVGYYKNDNRKGYTRFRAAEASGTLLSEDVKVTTRDRDRRCSLYKYYNLRGRCLRIGIAYDPEERAKKYAQSVLWWQQVDHSRDVIEWYATKEGPGGAREAEELAIKTENPIHNRQHRTLSVIRR